MPFPSYFRRHESPFCERRLVSFNKGEVQKDQPEDGGLEGEPKDPKKAGKRARDEIERTREWTDRMKKRADDRKQQDDRFRDALVQDDRRLDVPEPRLPLKRRPVRKTQEEIDREQEEKDKNNEERQKLADERQRAADKEFNRRQEALEKAQKEKDERDKVVVSDQNFNKTLDFATKKNPSYEAKVEKGGFTIKLNPIGPADAPMIPPSAEELSRRFGGEVQEDGRVLFTKDGFNKPQGTSCTNLNELLENWNNDYWNFKNDMGNLRAHGEGDGKKYMENAVARLSRTYVDAEPPHNWTFDMTDNKTIIATRGREQKKFSLVLVPNPRAERARQYYQPALSTDDSKEPYPLIGTTENQGIETAMKYIRFTLDLPQDPGVEKLRKRREKEEKEKNDMLERHRTFCKATMEALKKKYPDEKNNFSLQEKTQREEWGDDKTRFEIWYLGQEVGDGKVEDPAIFSVEEQTRDGKKILRVEARSTYQRQDTASPEDAATFIGKACIESPEGRLNKRAIAAMNLLKKNHPKDAARFRLDKADRGGRDVCFTVTDEEGGGTRRYILREEKQKNDEVIMVISEGYERMNARVTTDEQLSAYLVRKGIDTMQRRSLALANGALELFKKRFPDNNAEIQVEAEKGEVVKILYKENGEPPIRITFTEDAEGNLMASNGSPFTQLVKTPNELCLYLEATCVNTSMTKLTAAARDAVQTLRAKPSLAGIEFAIEEKKNWGEVMITYKNPKNGDTLTFSLQQRFDGKAGLQKVLSNTTTLERTSVKDNAELVATIEKGCLESPKLQAIELANKVLARAKEKYPEQAKFLYVNAGESAQAVSIDFAYGKAGASNDQVRITLDFTSGTMAMKVSNRDNIASNPATEEMVYEYVVRECINSPRSRQYAFAAKGLDIVKARNKDANAFTLKPSIYPAGLSVEYKNEKAAYSWYGTIVSKDEKKDDSNALRLSSGREIPVPTPDALATALETECVNSPLLLAIQAAQKAIADATKKSPGDAKNFKVSAAFENEKASLVFEDEETKALVVLRIECKPDGKGGTTIVVTRSGEEVNLKGKTLAEYLQAECIESPIKRAMAVWKTVQQRIKDTYGRRDENSFQMDSNGEKIEITYANLNEGIRNTYVLKEKEGKMMGGKDGGELTPYDADRFFTLLERECLTTPLGNAFRGAEKRAQEIIKRYPDLTGTLMEDYTGLDLRDIHKGMEACRIWYRRHDAKNDALNDPPTQLFFMQRAGKDGKPQIMVNLPEGRPAKSEKPEDLAWVPLDSLDATALARALNVQRDPSDMVTAAIKKIQDDNKYLPVTFKAERTALGDNSTGVQIECTPTNGDPVFTIAVSDIWGATGPQMLVSFPKDRTNFKKPELWKGTPAANADELVKALYKEGKLDTYEKISKTGDRIVGHIIDRFRFAHGADIVQRSVYGSTKVAIMDIHDPGSPYVIATLEEKDGKLLFSDSGTREPEEVKDEKVIMEKIYDILEPRQHLITLKFLPGDKPPPVPKAADIDQANKTMGAREKISFTLIPRPINEKFGPYPAWPEHAQLRIDAIDASMDDDYKDFISVITQYGGVKRTRMNEGIPSYYYTLDGITQKIFDEITAVGKERNTSKVNDENVNIQAWMERTSKDFKESFDFKPDIKGEDRTLSVQPKDPILLGKFKEYCTESNIKFTEKGNALALVYNADERENVPKVLEKVLAFAGELKKIRTGIDDATKTLTGFIVTHDIRDTSKTITVQPKDPAMLRKLKTRLGEAKISFTEKGNALTLDYTEAGRENIYKAIGKVQGFLDTKSRFEEMQRNNSHKTDLYEVEVRLGLDRKEGEQILTISVAEGKFFKCHDELLKIAKFTGGEFVRGNPKEKERDAYMFPSITPDRFAKVMELLGKEKK